jgi:hypothetical protein
MIFPPGHVGTLMPSSAVDVDRCGLSIAPHISGCDGSPEALDVSGDPAQRFSDDLVLPLRFTETPLPLAVLSPAFDAGSETLLPRRGR